MQTITGTRDQARAFLAGQGGDADEAAGVLAAAEQFPGAGHTPATAGPLSSTRCPPAPTRPPTLANPRSA
jgi:hypothetical protein